MSSTLLKDVDVENEGEERRDRASKAEDAVDSDMPNDTT